MGTKITARGVDAELTATEYAAPVRDGLLAWHFMSDNVAKSAKNYAPDQPDAVIVGAPTMISGNGGVQFKSSTDYLQTLFVEPTAATYFTVCRTLDTLADIAHRPYFFGADGGAPLDGSGGATFGTAFRVFAANALSAGFGRGTSVADDVAGTCTLTGITNTNWALIVHKVPGGSGVNTMINKTTGASDDSNDAPAPRFPSAHTLRVGSGYNAAYLGTSEIAEWVAYERLLPDTEIDEVVADIRAYQLRRFSRVV
jgi:hypothetical protein